VNRNAVRAPRQDRAAVIASPTGPIPIRTSGPGAKSAGTAAALADEVAAYRRGLKTES
jgi:hypothetical protein